MSNRANDYVVRNEERRVGLTGIAHYLKEIFPRGNYSWNGGNPEEVKAQIERIYGEAETIKIGEINYVVINGEYEHNEQVNLPNNISSLFYSSIRKDYAVIDATTSSILIDEVYSKIHYIQKDCTQNTVQDYVAEENIKELVGGLLGGKVRIKVVQYVAELDYDRTAGRAASFEAKVFQCKLLKDSGVASTNDVYNFILKNGEVTAVDDRAIERIKQSGEGVTTNIAKNHAELMQHTNNLRDILYDKYSKDPEVQQITLRSIFEIRVPFSNIDVILDDSGNVAGVYETAYSPILQESNVSVCNNCRKLLSKSDDELKRVKENRIRINRDAVLREDEDGNLIFKSGCETCLEECPECGQWHFNYNRPIKLDGVTLAPGREFVKRLRNVGDVNYCSCREGIEWVYDELSAVKNGRYTEALPLTEAIFVNSYVNDKLSSYAEYAEFNKEKASSISALAKFKKELSKKYKMVKDDYIVVTTEKNCRKCPSCGSSFIKDGAYSGSFTGTRDVSPDYRENCCAVCGQMVDENRRMLTRIDGVVFMRNKKGRTEKYVISRLGKYVKITERE